MQFSAGSFNKNGIGLNREVNLIHTITGTDSFDEQR